MMLREDENEEELRLNMDLFQEKREPTAIREARYKTKMAQYYNQKHTRMVPISCKRWKERRCPGCGMLSTLEDATYRMISV
ncbi:hypothetical protein Tco_0569649 [Tanacetum coccineum]